MGTIEDRNGIELTEAEDIKKRWQEYTELYKKDLHDPDNHDGMITHLEPDILKCKLQWTLGSITVNKGSGGDRIPAEPFQILKDEKPMTTPNFLCCFVPWATSTVVHQASFWPIPAKMSTSGTFIINFTSLEESVLTKFIKFGKSCNIVLQFSSAVLLSSQKE